MFMCQKRNETALTASRGPLIHSDQSLNGSASLLEQMSFGHVSTKQRCEIQCEAIEFSKQHKRFSGLN